MAQPETTEVEQAAGKRADYLVYYTRSGKPFLDAIYADSEASAEKQFLALAKEVGWREVEVDRVEARVPGEHLYLGVYPRFVVATCHEGSDWCVRRATQTEIDDPEDETLPLEEALDHGRSTARELGGRFYDFSTDPPPDEEQG